MFHDAPFSEDEPRIPNAIGVLLEQGSLYYQPQQCTIIREILQIHHTFALFDPRQIGNLMTPVEIYRFNSNLKLPRIVENAIISRPKEGHTNRSQLELVKSLFFQCKKRWSFLLPIKTSWWFQPIWKILYSQIGSFPQIGMNIKNAWNQHLESRR